MPTCEACTLDFGTQTLPPVCPRCGRATSRSPLSPATVIEAPGSTVARSSVRQNTGYDPRSAPLPKQIDGMDIVSMLGFGGMGSVYLAYEPLLDREVALKLLFPSVNDQTRAGDAARFLSEAVLTGRLSHGGIVPIHRIGYDPQHGYYYTMRYVRGQTLGSILHRVSSRNPADLEVYSLNRLLNIFLRVCEAMSYAHRNSIIHLDIKPANIMVTDFGETLLMDWGLARNNQSAPTADSEEGRQLLRMRERNRVTTQLFLQRCIKADSSTSLLKKLQESRPSESQVGNSVGLQGLIVGTPGYLSPEQGAADFNLSPASDVYSLGVTLYEMLTFRLPVDGHGPQELILATVAGNLVPIKQRAEAARLPKALCDIVTRALALNPADRFKDAGELAEELTLFLEGRAAWKPVVDEKFLAMPASGEWKGITGERSAGVEGLRLKAPSGMRCVKAASGDFRCALTLWAQGGLTRWVFGVQILELQATGAAMPQYEVRLGIEDRPFIELFRRGKRIQRRLDIRLRSAQKYRIEIELEQSTVRVLVDGRKYIEFQEVFPQIGGMLELNVSEGTVFLEQFGLRSRGAPLNLPFMAVPDQRYRLQRYAEARELYDQLAASHPDREEGLIGRYKSGLCSAALGELQRAFDEFTKLEGTMLDHCCALGLAQIGMLDGNLEWAWEALKNGFRRHETSDIRNEMWFAMLGLIDSLDASRSDEKVERYRDLITDLDSDPSELGRITCDLLNEVQREGGFEGVRAEAENLIAQFPNRSPLCREALLVLSRAGVSESAIPVVTKAAERALKEAPHDDNAPRWMLVRGEIHLAAGEFADAARVFTEVGNWAGPESAESLTARGWQVLAHYVEGQYQSGLMDSHEAELRFKRAVPAQLAYFKLFACLCYIGKGNHKNALIALDKAAEATGMWAATARHVLAKEWGEALRDKVQPDDQFNQTAEALWIAAELHRCRGDKALAQAHYDLCLQPGVRAMIRRLATNRH